VAVPIASTDTCDQLRAEVDDVICAITPDPFYAVGLGYEDFSQTTDEEVRDLLARSREGDHARRVSARRRDSEESQAMLDTTDTTLINAVRETAYPLTGAAQDYDPLIDLVGEARFVLLGEASHGTHEFYHMSAGSSHPMNPTSPTPRPLGQGAPLPLAQVRWRARAVPG
jgi:hypothetical protein